jgi:cytochrome o ubiquinol oxidase subunit II
MSASINKLIDLILTRCHKVYDLLPILKKRQMSKSFLSKSGLIKIASFFSFCILLTGCSHSGGVLNPKGIVASKERKLMFDCLALMLIVVIPVIIMSIAFALRYRKTHDNKSSYRPNWSHSVGLECIWWGVPTVIIVVLGILTWKSSHELDPYVKPADYKNQKPLVIDAVAMSWKWLFIYPKQDIATVNTLTIPKNRLVKFILTSDATPMSSFTIPQLTSQEYAMAGMPQSLYAVANVSTKPGQPLIGRNAQLSGVGLSYQYFNVNVVNNKKEFNHWVKKVKSHKKPLTLAAYESVRAQLNRHYHFKPETFSSVSQPHLLACIMEQFQVPSSEDMTLVKKYKKAYPCAYQLNKSLLKISFLEKQL